MIVDDVTTTPAGTHWRNLPPEEQAARLERARILYGDDERWNALHEFSRTWAACTVDGVLEDEDPRAKTYPCPKHMETAFIVGAGNTAWPCDCEAGTRVDAATWFSRIYSKRGRKFIRSDSEYAKFLSYLRQRSNGVALRDAVNRLLDIEEGKPAQGEA